MPLRRQARCDLIGYFAVLLRVAQENVRHAAQFTKPIVAGPATIRFLAAH